MNLVIGFERNKRRRNNPGFSTELLRIIALFAWMFMLFVLYIIVTLLGVH